MVGKQPIVLLKTVDGNKFLPIWIGHPGGGGDPDEAPGRDDAAADDARPARATCSASSTSSARRSSVTELRENTFFASITLSRRRPRDRDRLPPQRRARPRRPLGRPDLRRRGGHRRVGDRVRARGRGHRGGRREVQGVPRPGLARGLRRRRATSALAAPARAARASATVEHAARRARRSRCPAASAACGSRLVSVRPGTALASSTDELAGAVLEHQVDPREAAAAEQLVDLERELPGARGGRSSAELGRADEVACARSRSAPRSRRSPRRAGPPRRPAARSSSEHRHREVAAVHVALEQDLAVVGERGDERARHLGARARELDAQRASPGRRA